MVGIDVEATVATSILGPRLEDKRGVVVATDSQVGLDLNVESCRCRTRGTRCDEGRGQGGQSGDS